MCAVYWPILNADICTWLRPVMRSMYLWKTTEWLKLEQSLYYWREALCMHMSVLWVWDSTHSSSRTMYL